jgi:predicted O-methyltransferase YrrM
MNLSELVKQAYICGKEIDLSNVGYGRISWVDADGNMHDTYDQPPNYYYFLAGLVHTVDAHKILEIGTHCAGSIRAIYKGLYSTENIEIVTVDIADESAPYLKDYPTIKKIIGDANSMETIEQVLGAFDSKTIDLLYIDADHECLPTLLNYSIYVSLLRPKLVIFDDITLNDSMYRMWKCISQQVEPERAMNAAEVVPEIRPEVTHPGFGVVDLR